MVTDGDGSLLLEQNRRGRGSDTTATAGDNLRQLGRTDARTRDDRATTENKRERALEEGGGRGVAAAGTRHDVSSSTESITPSTARVLPFETTADTVIIRRGHQRAEIALKGATVFSYVSAGKERLFTSSKSSVKTADAAAVRGGIPICWPVFGPPDTEARGGLYSKLKQHGFARTSIWHFSEQDSKSTDEAEIAFFHLESGQDTLALFARQFKLVYEVQLRDSALVAKLHVRNPSGASSELPFQALLHSYLRLPAGIKPTRVRVSPLRGLTLRDKVQGNAESTEGRDAVDVQGPNGEVDRVYFDAPDILKVTYEGAEGEMIVKKQNLADVVLWNPGPEKGAAIGDMEKNGADKYVCLEPGQHFGQVSRRERLWDPSIADYVFATKDEQPEEAPSVGQRLHKLPGDFINKHESEEEGIETRLQYRLGPEVEIIVGKEASGPCMIDPLARDHLSTEWHVNSVLSKWWRPNFEGFMTHSIRICQSVFNVPKNMKLVALPLFELYDNAIRYGPALAAIPHLLSKYDVKIA
ncbi:hypothetical protein OIV83_000833 [Microbotryomycetes sp. JL201]|nr:hypothetical protein OIV83_000833 [Microbotryomycetes sp. JL201]